MDNRPIGIFDSGLGGLTVVKEIKRLLPEESLIYLGDTARVPYGTRSKEIVTNFAREDAEFLIKKDVKCIVIACNTASALAYKTLKKEISIPIFNVIEPGAKKALQESRNKNIGVIGTRATISSKAYEKELVRGNKLVKVHSVPCPLFVPLIEEGETEGKMIQAVVEKYLRDLKKADIDTLILGCTHYPIIKNVIAGYMKDSMTYVNPESEVASQLKEYLTIHKLLSDGRNNKAVNYYVTDINNRFVEVAEMFLGEKISNNIQKVLLG